MLLKTKIKPKEGTNNSSEKIIGATNSYPIEEVVVMDNMSWADELNLVDKSLLGSQLPMNVGFKTNIKP